MTLAEPATTTYASTWRTRSAFWWILLSALAIAVYAPLPYALNSLADLSGSGEPRAANYADRSAGIRSAFYLHIGFGGLPSCCLRSSSRRGCGTAPRTCTAPSGGPSWDRSRSPGWAG
jgi:hypothetical protein